MAMNRGPEMNYYEDAQLFRRKPSCAHDILMFILEWTTSLDSSSGTLICPSLCPRHIGRNNYVPLFGVDTIEWRLTRYYVIRDVIDIYSNAD